jgi:hypothetical protein
MLVHELAVGPLLGAQERRQLWHEKGVTGVELGPCDLDECDHRERRRADVDDGIAPDAAMSAAIDHGLVAQPAGRPQRGPRDRRVAR